MTDPNQLKRTAEWSFKDILFDVVADDASGQLWMGSSDANIYQMNLGEEKPERKPLQGDGHSSYVTGLARSGMTLLSCSYDRQLIWWDLESGKSIRRVTAHDKWIRDVIVTPDGTQAISVADDMRCRVWDIQSGEMIAEVRDHAEMTPHHYPSMLYAVAVSPDGNRIATGDRIGHVALWDRSTFEKVGEISVPVMYTWDPRQRRHSIGGVRSLAFSNDSSKLAIGGIGKIGNIDHLGGPARLEIFDVASGERLHEIEDNNKKGLIQRIAWVEDDSWLLTAGGNNEGFVTIYHSGSGEILHQDKHNGHVHAFCHDHQFANLFFAAHQKVSRWTLDS